MSDLSSQPANPADDNPFWDFSLEVYERDGVAASCLTLQDRRGLDVNLLLFCGWAAGKGWVFDQEDIDRLDASVAPWQRNVVVPLRELRRRLKDCAEVPGAETLRQRIKRDELQAEAIEQALLVASLPDGLVGMADSAAAAAAAGNMVAYLTHCSVVPDATDTADLAAVLRGCWPGLAPLEAVWLLSDALADKKS